MNTITNSPLMNELEFLSHEILSLSVLERKYLNVFQSANPITTEEYRSITLKYVPHVLSVMNHLAPIHEKLHEIESKIYDLSNYNHVGLSDDQIIYDTSIVPLFMTSLKCQKDKALIKLDFDYNSEEVWIPNDAIFVEFENETQITKQVISFRIMLEILNIKEDSVYFSFDFSDEIELTDDLKQFELNLIQKFDVNSILNNMKNN